MTTFDADAYRAAHDPFILVFRGRAYRARPVSAHTVIAVERDLSSTNHERQARAMWRLLRAAFPWRLRYLWIGDPVRLFLSADLLTRAEGLRRFFRFLGAVPVTPPATSGTPSPKPT